MRRFFQRLAYSYARFMQGRYGYDELNKTLLITALVLVVLSYLPFMRIMSVLSLLVMGYYIFRAYSKNHTARVAELNRYYVVSDKVKRWGRVTKARWRDRKTHVYFKCKECGALIRVPKHKGEIEVTCPRCRARTKKKT